MYIHIYIASEIYMYIAKMVHYINIHIYMYREREREIDRDRDREREREILYGVFSCTCV